MFHAQVSERMKVVDVLSTRVYSDSQQIIAQVNNVFVQSAFIGLFFLKNSTCFCAPLQLLCCFLSQGDLADCFYIVESGQVRITMKRSRVSLHCHPLDKPLIKKKNLWKLRVRISFSLLDKNRPRRGGGGHRYMLQGPVFWGACSRHKQTQSCICLCCGECQMLG